jgi:3-methyladenine DNA glycosylase AlkD
VPKTKDILDRLRAAGSTTPAIRAIARDLRGHPELAPALWSTNVLEARILATMIADPLTILEEEVERWVSEFDCWSVCDAACICLLWRTPFAWRKVREWSRRKPEYERRAAFALLAALAIHDKAATNKQFRAAFRLITKAATDDRPYVKKSVNWALRQIGKRNSDLREAAMDVAGQLIATESRSARWIGRDALRELSRRT